MNLSATFVLPTQLKQPSHLDLKTSLFIYRTPPKKKNRSIFPVARLFGPSIFEASKLKVLFLGVDEKKHPGNLPRTYTLTHSDITSKLTLAISQTINGSQITGWYNKLQRDEVVAEWKKVKGKMSLHVHCHISGGHFLLDIFAKLRFFIFCKELPMVLKAFVHGDGNLFQNYPELEEEALVWVYFHSNLPEFNRMECWGPLKDAVRPCDEGGGININEKDISSSSSMEENNWIKPEPCEEDCSCCFPPTSLITWSQDLSVQNNQSFLNQTNQLLQQQQQQQQ
ncbi:Stay-green-like protein [Thalictrum thalictroides]|uniref:Stay-green-like protein n=1 Tax=Thalictrum thalictroides TaxID=46969 RepID=A0A7J6VDX6_THATH|nr:Stay-green-like protein [Thalictrum thalictroides]